MVTRRSFLEAAGAAALLPLSGCSMTEALPAESPYNDGVFQMPEEAAPHVRTLMQWPVHASIYGGAKYLRETQSAIETIARAISRFEPVAIMAEAKHHEDIGSHKNIEFWDVPTDDLWARDSGPTFVAQQDGNPAVMDFNFNGWGNKQRHTNDALVARRVADRLGVPRIDSGLVGEAGGLEFDGEGTIIAHASSWVNTNRSRESTGIIGGKMMRALGAEKVIWASGIAGKDITDYHIDALARFVNPGRVLIQLPDKSRASDPWSITAYQTYDILKNARDAEARKLELIVVPEPVDIRSSNPEFVASYVNYYVCNGAVIAAEFGDDAVDEKARATLKALYPGREIVMLDVDPIGDAGGGIHCATQQQPAMAK
jgi:agmatine deiminase